LVFIFIFFLGQNVAKYSGSNLHQKIANDPKFTTNVEGAIKDGFLAIDEDLKRGIYR